MNKDLIIDVTSGEIVIALLEDKQLFELYKDKRNSKFAVGDIYLGKVRKTISGLNAAFVDVGYEKDAFLHYLDLGPQFLTLKNHVISILAGKKTQKSKTIPEPDIDKNGKINEVLSAGDSVMVQIAKEPISSKGPRLSSEITIAGRNLVIIPFSDKVTVSQKIKSSEERNRLRKLIQNIKPVNYGVIIRTAAEGKRVATLDAELRTLIEKWEKAFDNLTESKLPQLLIGELNRTSVVLRDLLNDSFNNVFVSNDGLYKELKEYIAEISPENQKVLKLYNGSVPIFEQFGIDKQIKSLFGKTITIKNGAYLIIEHTEALHVIDVNSGNRAKRETDQETNALQTNLAACEEITRQLRLRDLGGIIVIDFIDMGHIEHKQMVLEKMKEFMSRDSSRHTILPLSKFGIMEITRQRVRPETNIQVVEKCPTCKGKGEVISSILILDEIENHLKYIIDRSLSTKRITLKLHPFMASFLLKGFPSIRLKWFFKYKTIVRIKAVKSSGYLEYHFSDHNQEIIEL
ncbi:MAG: Rne/Rng family ribonuclease [Bacteroidia bacterium]|nr:Rne/Rng family ribonuclease [Bacteroidia bacterium]